MEYTTEGADFAPETLSRARELALLEEHVLPVAQSLERPRASSWVWADSGPPDHVLTEDILDLLSIVADDKEEDAYDCSYDLEYAGFGASLFRDGGYPELRDLRKRMTVEGEDEYPLDTSLTPKASFRQAYRASARTQFHLGVLVGVLNRLDIYSGLSVWESASRDGCTDLFFGKLDSKLYNASDLPYLFGLWAEARRKEIAGYARFDALCDALYDFEVSGAPRYRALVPTLSVPSPGKEYTKKQMEYISAAAKIDPASYTSDNKWLGEVERRLHPGSLSGPEGARRILNRAGVMPKRKKDCRAEVWAECRRVVTSQNVSGNVP
ncbi:MAG: hypothetical protein AAGN64_01005 [Bacteroidota bacterium]